MINDFHLKRCCDLLKDHGGKILTGNPNAHKDLCLKPTVVLEPRLDSDIMKEEIFGPLLPVLRFSSTDEAIKLINSMDKPLGTYYFGPNSSSNTNLQRYLNETSSGAFIVNAASV